LCSKIAPFSSPKGVLWAPRGYPKSRLGAPRGGPGHPGSPEGDVFFGTMAKMWNLGAPRAPSGAPKILLGAQGDPKKTPREAAHPVLGDNPRKCRETRGRPRRKSRSEATLTRFESTRHHFGSIFEPILESAWHHFRNSGQKVKTSQNIAIRSVL